MDPTPRRARIRTVKVVDAKTGRARLTLSGMEQDVLAVAASADGTEVISSGYDSQLFWWNATAGERTRADERT